MYVRKALVSECEGALDLVECEKDQQAAYACRRCGQHTSDRLGEGREEGYFDELLHRLLEGDADRDHCDTGEKLQHGPGNVRAVHAGLRREDGLDRANDGQGALAYDRDDVL